MKPIIALRIIGAVALASLIAWSNPAPAAEYHDTRNDDIIIPHNYTPEEMKVINKILAANQEIRDLKTDRDFKAAGWRRANRNIGERAYYGVLGLVGLDND